MVLMSEDQNVIRIVYISQSFSKCENKDCKKHVIGFIHLKKKKCNM